MFMRKINPFDMQENPFDLINKKWAMVTTRQGDQVNTMTASWGGVGVIWNKPAAFIFVRPQRFTREMLDSSERFSLCFLPETYRKELGYCGKASGRDEDKLAVCGFTTIDFDGAPAIAQSDTVISCRKLYRQALNAESFIDQPLDSANYPGKDYHVMYVAEILGVYENK